MGLMKQKIGDLTRAEKISLMKPLGTRDMPYPTVAFIKGEDGEIELALGVYSSNSDPLIVYSELPHDYVVGEYYRNMAVPSLLHVQEEGILRRNPNSLSRLTMLEGDPGSGKSHMAKTHARIQTQEEDIVVDCGGRNIGDLLFETVLDFGDDYRQAMNDRLLDSNVPKNVHTLLKEGLDKAYVEDEGTGKYHILWDQVGDGNIKKTEQAIKVLREAEYLMGLTTVGSNALGMRMKEGPLIQAFREGKNILLDEYTKAIEGSDDGMQSVLQFLVGEIDNVTVENKLKINGRSETFSFTFRREDMKVGFNVDMTGNFKSDGVTTHALDKSVYSRIDPFEIEKPEVFDWQHRVSQILTGLPLSTLYTIAKNIGDTDPESFSEKLVALRKLGLSDEQVAAIPASQITMLKNWQNTLDAVVKLSDFYIFWSHLVDPNSKLLDEELYTSILDEIDEDYRDRINIDFRQPIRDLTKALAHRPEKKDLGAVKSFNPAAIGSTFILEVTDQIDPMVVLGTSLQHILMQKIGNTTKGRPALRKALLEKARESGILNPLDLQEAKKSGEFKTLEDLLNQDEYEACGGTLLLQKIRNAVCNDIRTKSKGTIVAPDKEIVDLNAIAAAVENINALSAMEFDPGYTPLVVTNTDIAQVESDPLYAVSVVDSVAVKQEGIPVTFDNQELLRTRDLMKAFTLPASLGKSNMDHLWSTAIMDSGHVINAGKTVSMAQNTDKTEFAVTTIVTRDEADNAEPLHILRDNTRHKTLIIGGHLESTLVANLDDRQIEFVSRFDPQSTAKISAFVDESVACAEQVIKDRNEQRKDSTLSIPDFKKHLKEAFLLRNGDEDRDLPKSLVELLTDHEIPCHVPTYVTVQPFMMK